jgi:hypothetical protein
MMRLLVLFCFGWIVWTACVRVADPPAIPAMPAIAALPVPMEVTPVVMHAHGDGSMFPHNGHQKCGDGAVCNFSCDEGNCEYVCGSGSVCNASCDGGNCSLDCQSGAVCNISCDGGNCSGNCASGAVCSGSCDGGNCD